MPPQESMPPSSLIPRVTTSKRAEASPTPRCAEAGIPALVRLLIGVSPQVYTDIVFSIDDRRPLQKHLSDFVSETLDEGATKLRDIHNLTLRFLAPAGHRPEAILRELADYIRLTGEVLQAELEAAQRSRASSATEAQPAEAHDSMLLSPQPRLTGQSRRPSRRPRPRPLPEPHAQTNFLAAAAPGDLGKG